FFSSRRRHTRFSRDWSSDVCSSDLGCQSAVTQLRFLPVSFENLYQSFSCWCSLARQPATLCLRPQCMGLSDVISSTARILVSVIALNHGCRLTGDFQLMLFERHQARISAGGSRIDGCGNLLDQPVQAIGIQVVTDICR